MRDNVRGELPGRRELPGLRRMPALAIVALAVLALAGPVLPAAAATTDSDLFTVRNIPVDATAETAPAARDKAIAEGRRLGFRKLVERLVPASEWGHVPAPTDGDLQRMVLGFEVADEIGRAHV